MIDTDKLVGTIFNASGSIFDDRASAVVGLP